MNTKIITIDGPSGTGKSTVARKVADILGFSFLDTGALYRGAALAIERAGADPSDGQSCGRLISRSAMTIRDGRLMLNGEDVSQAIRENRISRLSSVIAAHPQVREALLGIQRNFADQYPTVAEGRDTGSVVFPNARIKIFLTASNAERARRRWQELRQKGYEIDLEQIQKELDERDQRDSSRTAAPLSIPENAIVVDTTHLSLGEVVEDVIKIAEERLAD